MNNKFVKKIYRESEIDRIKAKITTLKNYPFDEIGFLNLRLITTLMIFFIILLIFRAGYITSPIIALAYYYLYEYLFLDTLIIKRTNKLDREALTFFEVLTLSLESGRNLEKALEITVKNVNSELSDEFKKTLAPEANKRIGYRLMMDAIVEKEKLEVSEKELEEGIEEAAKNYGMKKEDFLKEIGNIDLFKYDLLMKKAMKLIVEDNSKKETKEKKTTKKSEK